MMHADDLLTMNRKQLERLLEQGHAVDPSELDDTEYCGVSLGLPAFVERLTWKKFKKVFHRDGEVLRGWNVRLQQNGLGAPWLPLMKGSEPRTFGHFRVVDDSGTLLLDYGKGNNHRLDPIGALRDPLVALNEGSTELLLGGSYLDLGFARVGTPSFFSLRRDVPLGHRVSPPRPRT
jgi:hypothetical protein